MPLIKNNYQYEAVTETVTKPIVAFRGILELLTSCAHKCRGCFVNKENMFSDQDLFILKDMIGKVNATGMIVDELVIGPVDFFGATNTEELLLNPIFQQIFQEYKPIFATPTTLMADEEEIKKRLQLINDYYPPHMEVEFLIVFNIRKWHDKEYLQMLKDKITLLDTIQQPTCYAFQLNAQNIQDYSLAELSKFIRDEFDTIIDIVPSFFRSHNPAAIKGMLKLWNKTINEQVTEENKNDIQMVIVDDSHAGYNYANLTYMQGKFYVSPFVHEIVVDTSDNFFVPSNTVKEITNHLHELRVQQFKYASQTSECEQCQYLSSCVSKFVLFYMEQYGLTDCILPKQAMGLFDGNMGKQIEMYDWSNYSVEDEIKNGTNYDAITPE